jgi:hypothetical protein
MTLRSPGHRVLRVLEMTGLDQVFHIDDGDERLEGMAKDPRASGADSGYGSSVAESNLRISSASKRR